MQHHAASCNIMYKKLKLSKVSQNSRCFQHTGIPRTLRWLTIQNKMSFGFETRFSSPSPWETGMISETNKTHGSPFHGRPHEKMIESTIIATQTTVMYMACKHEMVNWPKWFDQNPQTSHHINCCRHEYMTATTDSRNHCSQKNTQNKFTSFKFQVSQINCFTFPKQQKPQNRKLSLQIPPKK